MILLRAFLFVLFRLCCDSPTYPPSNSPMLSPMDSPVISPTYSFADGISPDVFRLGFRLVSWLCVWLGVFGLEGVGYAMICEKGARLGITAAGLQLPRNPITDTLDVQ